jgi:copper oxidase (laccase) domain-containing protein
MSARGADPQSMLAGIGPVIGAGRFEVGPDVVAAATDQLGERNLCAPSGRPDHWRFDLFGAIRSLLVRAGLEAGRISSTAIDTGPPGPFFSARAEGRCGRFALLARIQP